MGGHYVVNACDMSGLTSRDEVIFHILRLLEAHPLANQRGVARTLGVILRLVNFCLRSLADKGCIKAAACCVPTNKLGYT